MGLTREQLKIIKEEASTNLRYVISLEILRGKPTLRTWGYKCTKKFGFQIMEVVRDTLDKTMLSNNLVYNAIGGYSVVYPKTSNRYYEFAKGMYEVTNDFHPTLYEGRLFTKEELVEAFKEIPYLMIDDEMFMKPHLIKYLRAYKKDPRCEMLVKMGVGYLVTNNQLLKVKNEAKIRKIIKWINENKEFVTVWKPSYNFISGCAISGRTIEQQYDYQDFIQVKAAMSKHGWKNILDSEEKEIVKMAKRNGAKDSCFCIDSFASNYADYLIMAERAGYDLSNHNIRYPKDLIKAHDNVIAYVRINESKVLAEGWRKIKKTWSKWEGYEFKNYMIHIPTSQRELVTMGKFFSNCVGTALYGEEMANGGNIIVIVKKDGTPVECGEIHIEGKKMSIVQLRGKHNMDSEFHEEARRTVNNFMRSYAAA